MRADLRCGKFLQHANGGRRGKHPADAVLLDDAPPDAAVGPDGRALKHHRRHARQQRGVDDIGVAHHPADIRGAEEDAAGAAAENRRHSGRQRYGVAADVALYALGFAGSARGIQNAGDVAGFQPRHRHRRVQVLLAQAGVVHVTLHHRAHLRKPSIHQQHVPGRVAALVDSRVQQRLVGDRFSRPAPRIGGDNQRRPRVVDAGRQAVGGKAAEHHRVNSADARAGQQEDLRLGDHRHIDQHPVAAPDAERQQHRRRPVHLGVQLAKGESALLAGFRRNGDQRQRLRLALQPAVDGVVAQVSGAPAEPAGKGRIIVVQRAGKRRPPFDAAGLLRPEAAGIVNRALIIEFIRHRGLRVR